MSGGVQAWLMGLFCAAVLGVICSAAAGENDEMVRMISGIVLLLALCSPVAELNLTDVAGMIAQTQTEAEAAVSSVQVKNRELLIRIISERTASYILDKAESLGMTLEVQVSVNSDGAYPYPDGVVLTGRTTTAQRRRMNEWIIQELAIAEENLKWKEP